MRGGTRKGAGRPKGSVKPKSKSVHVRLRPDELATLDTLGAASHGKAIHELVRLTKRLGETV